MSSSTITINPGVSRTDQQWSEVQAVARTVVAGVAMTPQNYLMLALLALEYEGSIRDFKRANEQITELQTKLNEWVRKDRLERGITE